MSIASRITTMTEHIDDIYDTVELTGVDTTGVNKNLVNVPNTLKDGFVDIINNGVDTLYENFPKVAQTGEEPTLNGVYEAPMRVDLNGNTEQDSYTGKNLFNKYGDFTYGNSRYRTTLNELGQLVSTANYNNGRSAGLLIENLSQNTNYAFSGILVSANGTGNNSNAEIEIMSTASSVMYKKSISPSVTKPYNFSFTFNTGDNTSLWVSLSGTNSTIEGTTETIFDNLQLEIGSAATSYEPYVGGTPSPNPDYPQDIRVVKGDNTIKVTGKNLFDKNSTVQGILNADGTIGSGDNYKTSDFIKIDSTKTYTKTVSGSRRIKLYDKNKNVISTESYEDILDFNVAKTFTIPYSNAVYIRYSLSNDNVETNQLEQGSTATSYQPYQETTYPVDLIGKNLFNYNIIDVSTITIDTDGTLLISGINTANGYCHTQKTLSQLCPNLQVGDTAYLYLDTDFYENDNLKTYIYAGENWGNGKSKEITQTMLDTYVIVYGGYQTTSHLKIMVTKTLDTSYEQYYNYELCKIGDYKDYIYKENDKWYKHSEIGKIDLSTLTWSSTGADTSDYRRYYTNTIPNIKYVSSNTQVGNGIAEKYTIVKGQGISSLINALAIDVSIVSVIDLESNNNPTGLFYYALATPTDTEITDTTLIEQLEDLKTAKSVEGQTNITQVNEELPFILDVSGLKKD